MLRLLISAIKLGGQLHLKNQMLITLILFLAVVAISFFIFLKLKSDAGKAGSLDYKARSMMTANELEFLERLESAAPELRFHSQVAMGAIVEPNTSRRENGREYMRLRGKVAQKVVDFVAQDRKNGKIVALIELDDKTHQSEKDAARDAITAAAGYKTLRWNSRKKPDANEIRSSLRLEPRLK